MLVSVFGKQMINVVAQVSMPDLKHPSMFAAKGPRFCIPTEVGVSEEAGVSLYMQ